MTATARLDHARHDYLWFLATRTLDIITLSCNLASVTSQFCVDPFVSDSFDLHWEQKSDSTIQTPNREASPIDIGLIRRYVESQRVAAILISK